MPRHHLWSDILDELTLSPGSSDNKTNTDSFTATIKWILFCVLVFGPSIRDRMCQPKKTEFDSIIEAGQIRDELDQSPKIRSIMAYVPSFLYDKSYRRILKETIDLLDKSQEYEERHRHLCWVSFHERLNQQEFLEINKEIRDLNVAIRANSLALNELLRSNPRLWESISIEAENPRNSALMETFERERSLKKRYNEVVSEIRRHLIITKSTTHDPKVSGLVIPSFVSNSEF